MGDPSATAFVTGGSGFLGGRLTERLVRDGWVVRALARSDAAAAKVARRGAEPVRGDLDDGAALRAGARGCAVAFHAAALAASWGPRRAFVRANVDGTRNVLAACADAGVARFVHVGTEAALMDGAPLVNVDERAPLRPGSSAYYPATKARAELAVLDASRPGFATVVVRPRLIWGPGDTTVLPGIVAAIRDGRFAWIGSGRQLTSTTHVDNAVHGLVLAAARGAPAAAYFVSDGEQLRFRDFITDLLATQGVTPPERSVPAWLARPAAAASATAWRALRREEEPPLTRLAVWLMSLEATVDISRARRELDYAPVRTVTDGLAELHALRAAAPTIA